MTYLQIKQTPRHYHKHFVDIETNDAVCLCGKVQGVRAKNRTVRNKYNASTCFYNGYWYDSKFEAAIAMDLDFRLKGQLIKGWDRQFQVEIVNPKTNERLCRHKVDFRVHNLDGSFTLLESKGYPTPEWKKTRKELEILWLPEHLDYDYQVVTEKNPEWRKNTLIR